MIGKRAFAFCAGIAVIAAFAWLVGPSHEPRYIGKRLRTWLKELENYSGDTNDEAFVAFRQMGTNAIPVLLKIIDSGGPPIQKAIFEVNRNQSIVNLPFGDPWRQELAGSWALYAMGTNARPALPTLTNWLFHTNHIFTSATALAGIGSDAMPSLFMALTNQDSTIRYAAAGGLADARSDFDMIITELLKSLNDQDGLVRCAVVGSLGALHTAPDRVVPALIKRFDAENDLLVRRSILNTLGRFGAKAQQALPLVIEAMKDPNEPVRTCAAKAFKKIDAATEKTELKPKPTKE